jgi:hypothetical protein
MRSIFCLTLLVLSLFPACKRNNEHTQSSAVSSKHQAKQLRTLPGDTCELVAPSKLGRGIVCLVATPVVAGAGTFLSLFTAVACGGIHFFGFSLVACLPAIGIFAGTLAGTGFVFYKGCSYLSQHARANKERERARCQVCKKIHKKEELTNEQTETVADLANGNLAAESMSDPNAVLAS